MRSDLHEGNDVVEEESHSQNQSEHLNKLSVDQPLTEPKADRLGYDAFARHLADSLCGMTFTGGFVVAVYGPWGSGKSTLTNFLVYYLKQKPESEQPIIVPFNPWLFSGDADITKLFFDQLQTVITKVKAVPKGLKERIANLAKIVSQIPVPYAQTGGAVASALDEEQKDTSELKEEVEDTLQQQHPRIVVIIDDVDRLAADEIRQLFHVITASPDFTNVIYFLVFDKEIVTKALAEVEVIPGEAYLERIIQVSFELPFPDKISLRRLLFEKLNDILSDIPEQLFEPTRWRQVYFQGLDHFINTTRDIVRLTNIVSMVYPLEKGEVNPVDLIAIEALRVFCPLMYNAIRKNPTAFTGVDNTSSLDSGVDKLRSIHNSWIAQLPDKDKEPVKRLIMYLFPKLETVWNNIYYDEQQESVWRQQFRVCSSEIFPIYFRLALPEGKLSDSDMKIILPLARDAKVFGESLVELAQQKYSDGTSQVRIFLERLEDYTEQEIATDCIPSIVQALFDVGDQLVPPEDVPGGIFDFGNEMRIRHIVWQLLYRLDEPRRFEVLKEAISKGKAISTIVREVVNLGRQQGKYGAAQPSSEAEWLISTQHLKELEELALKKVQNTTEDDTPLQTSDLSQLLNQCC